MFRRIIFTSALLAATAWAKQSECSNHLCRLVMLGRCDDLRWPDYADLRTRLQQFYEPSGYSFAWTSDGKATDGARRNIALLEGASLQGLDPADYDAGRWQERLERPQPTYFDLTLTVCLLRYLSDLHYGKSNPAFFHVDAKHDPVDLAGFVRANLIDARNPEEIVAKLEPPFDGYRRTKAALRNYLKRAAEADIRVPEIDGEQQISARLKQLGDSSVKSFQARHGLETDGRVGKATREQLNVPVAQRVLQLRLSLERWRWVPHVFQHPPVVVNVPEFSLRALDSEMRPEIEMKVVVGSAFEHQTPTFAANMTTVTFRPYWNVPRSILVNEMAEDLETDRYYLLEHNYEVVNGADKVLNAGKPLSEKIIDGLNTGRYRIRQLPGPTNALGLIRFGIPNPYNVYLHATPAQPLFGKARRDFSHGCVRVEEPVKLAEWALKGTDSWTRSRILRAMRASKTLEVKLAIPIPVLIVYATAVVAANDEVHFFPDIYGQDTILENRLTSGYPSRDTAHDK